MVRGVGLEPTCLAAYAPQTYVSTNFTTRAEIQISPKAIKILQVGDNITYFIFPVICLLSICLGRHSCGLFRQRRSHEIPKKRMRLVRLGLEFRMELTANEPAMPLDLNDLDELTLDVGACDDQAF